MVDPSITLKKHKKAFKFFPERLAQGIELEMMLIPAGAFTMGAIEAESGSCASEYPQHQVAMPHFFMSKTPVTQAQWRVVAGLPKIDHDLALEPAGFKSPKRPVEQVNWYEAMEFCQRLSTRVGKHYTLPSEAQWEYACRAGTQTPFHFGQTITAAVANYDASHASGPRLEGKYRRETTPVDHFEIANEFGLWDMHGNVWEWCLDDWHDNYDGAPNDGSAWLKTDGRQSNKVMRANRVMRGGSWFSDAENCRSARRHAGGPNIRNHSLGFRLVCLPTAG